MRPYETFTFVKDRKDGIPESLIDGSDNIPTELGRIKQLSGDLPPR